MVRIVETTSQSWKNMTHITNSDLVKHVLLALFNVVSRRTSASFSLMVLTDILKTLEKKFVFLEYVKIKKSIYVEGSDDIIDVLFDMDDVGHDEIAKAIESFIRIASMNMKNEEAGFYFITELKNQIKDRHVSELKKYGVDIDLIQLEQHCLYKQSGRKISLNRPHHEKFKPEEEKHSKYVGLMKYSWDKVAFWEYDNNICTIYNKKGNVLDKLPLDKIVKDYMMEMTGFDEVPLDTNKLVEISEKEYEFIQMLYSKDMDAETAMHLMHISREELSLIIRKLLVYEVLQYVSYDEVMLTKIGITVLAGKQKKRS